MLTETELALINDLAHPRTPNDFLVAADRALAVLRRAERRCAGRAASRSARLAREIDGLALCAIAVAEREG